MADRAALSRGMDELAREWVIFTVCTVVLTPFALAIAGVVLLVSMAYAGLRFPGEVLGFALTIEVFLGLAILGVTLGEGRKRGHGLPWCGAAGLVLAVMVGLVHGIGLVGGPLYALLGVGALLVLGLLGWAYAPKEQYYLGWLGGRVDDPFTVRDDADRAHVGLGFAIVVPRLIVASWASIVGDVWMLKKLSFRELEAAAAAIDALGRGDGKGAADALHPLGRTSAAHVLRALERMKLIRGGVEGGLRLTEAGRRMASPGKPPAPTIEQRRPDGRAREAS